MMLSSHVRRFRRALEHDRLMNVTIADVKMRDGSRLEKTGVIPDEILLPTGEALSKRLDPVLAYVITKFGVEISPEKAGALNFLAPKEEGEDDADEETN